VSVGGRALEVRLPSDALGPCSVNANAMMVCPGGHLFPNLTAHDNGLFVIDTTKPAAILRHLEDTSNYGEFGQAVQENGGILAANANALVKWGP
jgi:hypothetical protein